jgi:hypothetical protein
MDHFEQTPGTDHGQGESDEALLQKMEQEQLSAGQPPARKLLYTRKEAAALLGLKTATLRCWATIGRGPRYLKLHSGSRAPVRYTLEELQAYAKDPAGYQQIRNTCR